MPSSIPVCHGCSFLADALLAQSTERIANAASAWSFTLARVRMRCAIEAFALFLEALKALVFLADVLHDLPGGMQSISQGGVPRLGISLGVVKRKIDLQGLLVHAAD